MYYQYLFIMYLKFGMYCNIFNEKKKLKKSKRIIF